MKRMFLALIASMMLLPAISFAETTPPAPAAWVTFQNEENAKKAAFFKQLKADMDAFLSSHPEVKAYLDQLHAIAHERIDAQRALHHK
jgi:hypothetical protein